MPPILPWVLDPINDFNIVLEKHWGQPHTLPLPVLPGLAMDTDMENDTPRPMMHDLGTAEFLSETMGKFIIREEYEIAMKRIIDFLALNPLKGVLITGQQGIGKTIFLYYIIVERLQRKLVTGFTQGQTTILFTAEGIYSLDDKLSRGRVRASLGDLHDDAAPIWMLIDVDVGMAPDLPSLISPSFFPIQAASMNPEKFKSWSKQKNPLQLIMNPWSWEEIYFGFALQYPTVISAAQSNITEFYDRFDRFGPSARTVYNTSTIKAEGKVRAAISEMSADKLFTFHKSNEPMNLDAKSCLVLLSRKKPDGDIDPTDDDDFESRVITKYVLDEIFHASAMSSYTEQRRAYFLFRYDTTSSATAGLIFEYLAHDMLSGHRAGVPSIYIYQMQEIANNTPGTTSWTSKCTGTKTFLTLRLQQRRRKCFAENYSGNYDPTQYYVPEESSNPTFDSFFVDAVSGPQLQPYAFQMTISEFHSIKEVGLTKLWNRLGFVGTKIRFILVIPPGQDIQTGPIPNNRASFFEFYSCRLPLPQD